eukprot:g44188.t1
MISCIDKCKVYAESELGNIVAATTWDLQYKSESSLGEWRPGTAPVPCELELGRGMISISIPTRLTNSASSNYNTTIIMIY